MPVKAKFSSNYYAVAKRLQRLPKFVGEMADTITKKDAEGLIEEYQKGIREKTFHLTALSSITVKIKKDKGYSKPYTPLYGAGDDKKNSLLNALRIRKIRKGYRVFVSWAKHHKSGLTLKQLSAIHEEGALIAVTPKMRAFLHYIGIHLKKDTTIIRIPPRPVRKKAFKRFLAKKLREENIKKARQGIINYLRTGNTKGLK
jgi:hypothetical protein